MGVEKTVMKIAIAQLNPLIGDIVGNAKAILIQAQQAATAGVDLLVTSELSLCGYPPRDLLMDPSFTQKIGQNLAELASKLPPEMAVLIGTVESNPHAGIKGEKPLFNSVALCRGGKAEKIFHKRLLPTYDVFDEDRYFEPGLESNFFTLKSEQQALKIGVTVCEDLWNDEDFWGKRNYQINPITDLAEQGTDLIVNLSASPYSVGKQKLRESMLQHIASRYQQPIIYVNQVGGNDDLIFDGSSIAFNRQGTLLCRAKAFTTDTQILEFNISEKDLQAPLDAITPLPDCEDAEIWSALVLGVRDYVQKCRFSKIVIGLSGGIDSSLVAAIATAAIGAKNVLGVLMPSPYSSDHSVQDALKLAENLGIETQILPIQGLMTGFDETLSKLFTGTESGIAEENLQSRIRGNLLMAISNKFGHLLISTGNKSEMAVGYCTLYGDMDGGLAAIADVPKTRVYTLCHWLNAQIAHPPFPLPESNSGEIIPSNVLIKPPSAELKPDQTDQDSLPPYDILDDILHRFIHEHQSSSQIIAAGHDPQTVQKVLRLVARAEFKRRQASPGLKITQRAFGTGWRMPIAAVSNGY